MEASPIVASRKTFDGVAVFLHADGSLSTHTHFLFGGKLPAPSMWRFIDDVCLMLLIEVVSEIRAERAGKRRGFAIRDWVPASKRVYLEGPRLANGLPSMFRIR